MTPVDRRGQERRARRVTDGREPWATTDPMTASAATSTPRNPPLYHQPLVHDARPTAATRTHIPARPQVCSAHQRHAGRGAGSSTPDDGLSSAAPAPASARTA